jgi:hypothetical protein
MAFIIYHERYKGKLAQTISRKKALQLRRALKTPHLVKNDEQRKYLENIKSLNIPEAGRSKPEPLPTPELFAEPEVSGKDRAAGES